MLLNNNHNINKTCYLSYCFSKHLEKKRFCYEVNSNDKVVDQFFNYSATKALPFSSSLCMTGTECCLLQAFGSGACVWRPVRFKQSSPPGFWPGWGPHWAGSAEQSSNLQHLLHSSGHHYWHSPATGLPQPAWLLPLPPESVPCCHHVGPFKPWRLWSAAAALSLGVYQPTSPAGGSAVEMLPLCSPAAEKAGSLRLWPLQGPQDSRGYGGTRQGAPGEILWHGADAELWQHSMGPKTAALQKKRRLRRVFSCDVQELQGNKTKEINVQIWFPLLVWQSTDFEERYRPRYNSNNLRDLAVICMHSL